MARSDISINPLDQACKDHDIKYSKNRDNIEARNVADRVLASKARNRVKSGDASLGEKAAALAVAGIMKTKSKLGMGHNKKKTGSGIALKKNEKRLMVKSKDANKVITSALKVAKE